MAIDYTARFAGEWIDHGGRGFNVHHPACAGGAVGDGIADDRAALAAADALGPAEGSPGKTYRIGGNLILKNGWRPNASVLRPSAGGLISIAGSIEAGSERWIDLSLGGKVGFAVGSVPYVAPDWWGATGDGVTDDGPAIEAAIAAAILSRSTVQFKAGTFVVDPARHAAVGVKVLFTSSGQSLRVRGAGRGLTVFKEKAGATAAGGRYTRMFYVDLAGAKLAIDAISFEDCTFDKNGASNGAPPSGAKKYDWEAAHAIAISGDDNSTIASIQFVRTSIRDKVGAGIYVAAKMQVTRVIVDDFYEEAFSGLFGERGDVEITCWCSNILFHGLDIRYTQTEPERGYEASAGHEKHWFISDCPRIGVFQWAEPEGSQDYASIHMANCRVNESFSVRGVPFETVDCDLRFTTEHWAKTARITGGTIRLAHNAATNTFQQIYVRKYATTYKQDWHLSGVRILIDTLDRTVRPRGTLFMAAANTKSTAKDDVVIRVDSCWLDERAEFVADAYGTGTLHVTNSDVGCWGSPAFRVGGHEAFVGALHLRGNDYERCTGKYLLAFARGNGPWEVVWDERLPIALYRVESIGSTDSLKGTYTIRPTLVSAARPTSLSQPFHAGLACVNSAPSAQAPVTKWICTADGTPGSWAAVEWVIGRNTTSNRPTLHPDDVGVCYIDTTLARGGKPIWWSGTAWVDAVGATE